MSYPKKPATNKPVAAPQPLKTNDPKREKLLAIQEREQLKGLLVSKFLEKYGKDKKANQDYVNKQVAEFMKNEKVTEENLKKLEQRIRDGTGAPKSTAPSQKGGESPTDKDKNAAAPSQKGKEFQEDHDEHHHHHTHHHHYDDAASVASSDKPKSVYVQGDSDDEWATMMKYDTELFKKEKELAKLREQEQKRKIKEELDRQIEEKKWMKGQENNEEGRYNELIKNQMTTFDKRENKKEVEMKSKVMQEKASRDKQLQEEHLRKKIQKRAEKEMDGILVNKIKEEIDDEARNQAVKRFEDKEALRNVLIENEQNKVKMAEDARKEKESDIKAQKEYTRLIEKQEADRAAEFKAREDKAKQFMNMMADTVVKDQKQQILAEERNMLKQYLDREEREIQDDKKRQQRLNDQKKEMRNYLDQQMVEKEKRRQEEAVLEKKQAEIWKKDTEDYNEHEKKKAEYVKDVNQKHAGYLEKQIEAERKRNKKISTQELLLNKQKLKEIADKEEGVQFQKQLVKPK